MKYERCPRQWWFAHVRGLYVPSDVRQTFGIALHACCAAWLSFGQPDPFWADGLTPEEQASVNRMMAKAVAQKVLTRRRGLLVEHKFTLQPGVTGVIDCLDLNGVVIDHKTASSDRWLKTREDLRNDIPMMVYAGYLLSREKLDRVWLRHNQFITGDETVTFTEVDVTAAEVRTFWKDRIIPALRGQQSDREVKEWQAVAGHPEGSDPCLAYRGCPYTIICHNGQPVEEFTAPTPGGEVPF